MHVESLSDFDYRYEAILLEPGENKIDVEIDTRESRGSVEMRYPTLLTRVQGLPSAAIFTFHKEDHTLANMLRARLLKTPNVIFAAYRV